VLASLVEVVQPVGAQPNSPPDKLTPLKRGLEPLEGADVPATPDDDLGVEEEEATGEDDLGAEDDLGEEEGDLGEHSGESGSGSGSGALHGDEEDLEDWHIPRDIEDAAGALPSTSAADNPGLVLGEPITGILNRARLGIEGPRRGYEVGRGYLPEGMTPEMHRELEALGDHSPMAAASPSSVQGVSVVDVRSRDEESDPDGDEADSARERAIGAKRKR